MTDDVTARLDAIEQRANATTAGPWAMYNGFGPADDGYHRVLYIGNPAGDLVVDTEFESADVRVRKADAEFIALAREDVPWLITEVRRLRESVVVSSFWCGQCRELNPCETIRALDGDADA